MHPRKLPRIVLAMLSALLVCSNSATVWAVTDEEIFRDFRFNFINPGARSLGLGGAFISIADDATAAVANPSGLTNLASSQFFFEVRYASADPTTLERSFTDPFSDPGAPDGFNISVSTEPDSMVSPSFFSYVQPWKSVCFGLSRQEVLNVQSQTQNRHEFLFGGLNDIRKGDGNIDLELVNWNASFAFKIHESFRLGLTISYGQFSQDSQVLNSYEDPTGGLIGDPNFAGIPFELYSTSASGSDSDFYFTAGFLWNIVPTVSLGGVYRQGGRFSVEQTLAAQTMDQSLVPGRIAAQVFLNESGDLVTSAKESFVFTNVFHVPDVIGVGLSWRPTERLTFAIDADHVTWSSLVEGYNSRLNILTVGWQSEEEASFTVDDQTNLHFGVEYVLAQSSKNMWAIRGGYYQERDNRLRADFPDGEFGYGLANNATFPEGEDENHYSLGLGIVIGDRFQMDLGAEASSSTFEAVWSLTYRL